MHRCTTQAAPKYKPTVRETTRCKNRGSAQLHLQTYRTKAYMQNTTQIDMVHRGAPCKQRITHKSRAIERKKYLWVVHQGAHSHITTNPRTEVGANLNRLKSWCTVANRQTDGKTGGWKDRYGGNPRELHPVGTVKTYFITRQGNCESCSQRAGEREITSRRASTKDGNGGNIN